MAQTQRLPGPAEPGQIEKRFEQPPVPRADDEPLVSSRTDLRKPPENADSIRFSLQGVVIEGVSVYAQDAFLPLYENLLGNEITLAQVFKLADAITAKYRTDGYVLSLVIVPPQRIAAGIVRLRVVEGFIDGVVIEGELGGRESLMREMADKIVAARPLNVRTLERYILLIDDLPGITARAVLKPSKTPGAADLVLRITERPVNGYASFDNRGSRYLGPLQGSVSVNANSVLGNNERTTISATVTSQVAELKYLDVSHSQPLTSEGTRLRIGASRSYANPGFTLKSEDVHSEATTITVDVSHPVIRSRAMNLSVRVRFGMRNIKADLSAGTELISKDRIRALRLRMDYDFVDSFIAPAVNLLSIEGSQGVDILGAQKSGSPDLSRTDGRSDFTKVTASAQRLQTLTGGFSLMGAVTAQYAMSTLLASEEFAFGGSQFGRGYDPAEITGDHGAAAKLEIRFGSETNAPLLRSYQVYGFYDIGAVWNRDRDADEAYRNSMASAGVGVRANLTDSLSANVEFASPLTGRIDARSSKGEDARIFFTLAGRF